ncbi:TIGR02677 family protein [Fusobacterium ulcerans]|uniref:Protein of uncharacterized function (DUF2397) n=1 Tax=Fusobacterium ulcerans TaxID=861 RepID=A0AAX2JD96_9FUSO|nr:TIGR02677 family protein [Fusobacterium ulcerans]AVQ27167.1 TIGR02677 family protein [Fusobacterium ulcerans]EFS24703.1 TIGR02677 family protein [Fusobacterium ulcerans ATCC 49185]SQJ11070.1 Protein of uncharacterised function (DUF2397) [Fusobacterium ulcerans]
MDILDQIKETSYLSTQKTIYYRRIMRVFFREYEKMKFQLYKEDIFEEIKKYSEFDGYTIDELKSDLDILVEWKNLTAIQDSRKVYTIAEFKNREYRYSMSEKSVIIERMTVSLENLYFETGNLSTNYIPRMQEALEKIRLLFNKKENYDEIYEYWENLQEDFRKLNQNYQDYLREFYTKKTENLMKTIEFIVYKEKFISILRNFVRELQINSSKMETTIDNIKDDMEKGILDYIIKNEVKNQELNLSKELKKDKEFEDEIGENIRGKWESLKNWFGSSGMRKSEYRQVMDITEEIIGKIIQNAFFITQKQNWGVNKKEEYKKFIKMFIECEDMDEAHKLSAHIFGIQNIRHYGMDIPRSTDSSENSAYDEEYMEYILESHNRTYKPKIEKTGFEDRKKLKEELSLLYKKKLEEDREMIMKYLQNGILDISKIDENISSEFRIFILNLITSANISVEKTGRTEYGQKYKMSEMKEKFVLKCEDGNLEMSKYIFEFLED